MKKITNNIKNRTEQFIELINSGKTLDYILFYNILVLFVCL